MLNMRTGINEPLRCHVHVSVSKSRGRSTVENHVTNTAWSSRLEQNEVGLSSDFSPSDQTLGISGCTSQVLPVPVRVSLTSLVQLTAQVQFRVLPVPPWTSAACGLKQRLPRGRFGASGRLKAGIYVQDTLDVPKCPWAVESDSDAGSSTAISSMWLRQRYPSCIGLCRLNRHHVFGFLGGVYSRMAQAQKSPAPQRMAVDS